MSQLVEINEEVLYTKESAVRVSRADIDFIKTKSYSNKRKRIRLCAHKDADDSVHEMFIVHHSGNYVPPHNHFSKVESYHLLEGVLDVIVFDNDGLILDIIRLDEKSKEGYFYYRIPKGLYHMLIAISDIVIFHEITNGPFDQEAINMHIPKWAPSDQANTNTIQSYLKTLEYDKSLFTFTKKKLSDISALIVGADGLIGGAIKEKLQLIGADFFETTRRADTTEGKRLYLDLVNPILNWEIPKGVQISFICAGVVKIVDCEEAPEDTYIINVENTLSLVRRLLDAGSTVVYFSSALVSDIQGAIDSPEEEIQSNEYSRQKAEVERTLLEWNDDIIILRMTKVLSPNMSLIKEWIKCLKNGTVIHPISNLTMAPITINYLLNALLKIVDSSSRGIFNLTGDRDISYADTAAFIAKKLGVDEELVQPVTAKEVGFGKLLIPNSTILDNKRTQKEFSIEPAEVLGSISKSFSLW
jgi:cupin fold WbuC family metalloprotein